MSKANRKGKAKNRSRRSPKSKVKNATPQKMKKRVWKHQGR